MSDRNARYRQNPEAIATFLNSDEAVIVHGETKLSYGLNATGIAVWNLLKEDRSVDDLANGVCMVFAVDREQAREGVVRFIQDLLSFRLIVPAVEEGARR